jgi:glycosyltransferase involved in cell wall biosynthesis
VGFARQLTNVQKPKGVLVAFSDLPFLSVPTERRIVERWQGNSNDSVVSILCTTYNHEAFIESALVGFLNQETSFPFEILVRDDGSTDGTQDVLARYESRYRRLIRLFVEPENTFFTKSPVQELRRHAKGEFVAICDGDDYWTRPDKLQRQVEALLANPNAAFVHHAGVEVDETGAVVRRLPPERARMSLPSSTAARGFRFLQSSVLYRNKSIPWIPYPPLDALAQDVITAQLVALTGDVVYIPDFEGTVRRLHGSNSGLVGKGDGTSASVRSMTTRIFLARILVDLHEPRLATHFLAESVFRTSNMLGSLGISPFRVLGRAFLSQAKRAIFEVAFKFQRLFGKSRRQ